MIARVAFAAGTVCVLPAVALSQAPAVTQTANPLASSAGDFWHFAKIARYDVAAMRGKAVLESGATPLEVLLAFEQVASSRKDDLSQTMLRWSQVPELKDTVLALQEVLVEGRYARRSEASFITQSIDRLIVNEVGYRNGLLNLRNSGELSVPIMLDYLRSPSKAATHGAIRRVLRDLGKDVLNPLVAATATTDQVLLAEIAKILGEIGYADAGPYLLKIAANAKSDNLRSIALASAAQVGMSPGTSVAAAQLDLAEKFYYSRSAIIGDPRNPVAFIWSWDETTGLSKENVPHAVFAEIMAMRLAREALASSDADSTVTDAALSLWLAADYKREVELAGAIDPTRPESMPGAHYYGVTAGPKYLAQALTRTLNDGDVAVAFPILQSMQQIVGRTNVNLTGEASSLIAALRYPDRRVRFEAALALAASRPSSPFDASDVVVPTLGEALTQTGMPQVVIASGDADLINGVTPLLTSADIAVTGVPAAGDLVATANGLAGVNVLVIDGRNDIAEAERKLTAAGATLRLRSARKLVLTLTTQSSFESLARTDPNLSTVVVADAAQLADAVNAVLASSGAIDADAAQAYALRAAAVMRDLAVTGSTVLPLTPIRSTLVEALSDSRRDVSVAVAMVLADFDDAIAQQALLARGLNTELDPELRVTLLRALAANVRAYGSRLADAEVVQLDRTVLGEADADVRAAAAEARGALNLPADQGKRLILSGN
jgi:hypothetical protein